jgi:hypothetical protein
VGSERVGVSKIKLVRCDMCGRREDSPQYREGRAGRHLIHLGGWEYVGSMNLCPECYTAFREWKECEWPPEAEHD